MSRSRALVGRNKQLDRARQRGRLDRGRAVSERDDDQALQQYLKDRFTPSPTIAEIDRLDLLEFLRQTAGFHVPSNERLRQLAIFLEDAARDSQPSGWLALSRIYERAEQLVENVDDLTAVLSSVAITAHYTAESAPEDDGATERRLWNTAYSAIHRAIETDPSWSKGHSILAQMRYRDPNGDLEEGLADCERALEQDPANGWAQYHRACILQALERFQEAAQAFEDVNFAFFTGERSERLERILEARAVCLLLAGHRDLAVKEFEALLSRYERSPSLARNARWWDIVEVATGELKEELGVRAKALVQRYADYMIGDFADIDDCARFIEIVRCILTGLVEEQAPHRVGLFKIDHWFSQRWRGFIGKMLGLVGARSTSTNSVPPFHPHRVVSELQFALDPKRRYQLLPNPPRMHIDRGNAFDNQRALTESRNPSVWLWYSGRSCTEDRASVMVYIVQGDTSTDSFYVEYSKTNDGEWKPSKLVGVGSERLATFTGAGASTEEGYPWVW